MSHIDSDGFWTSKGEDAPVYGKASHEGDVPCLCGVTEPDEFGQRDLIEHPDCPFHAAMFSGHDHACCPPDDCCGGPCAAHPCWDLTT